MIKFSDIPQFPRAYYAVDVNWKFLKEHLERLDDRKIPGGRLEMNPDFQRGHVWTEAQQISYIEYCLKGGTTGLNVYFNCSSWQDGYNTATYCVDGLQRITAILAFLDDKIPAFGQLCSEFGQRIPTTLNLKIHMLKIRSKKELLKIYLDFNSGGTPHDPSELVKVQKMIDSTNDSEVL